VHHMIPIVVARCSATLHVPDGAFSRVVVFVNSFGYEGAYTTRAWVTLGEDIADAGIAFLRYDLPDQGDSIDLQVGEDAASAWINSILEVVDWTRKTFPGVDVVLSGYRLGALMVAVAAKRSENIAGLLLFSPVLSGRNFIREVRLQAEKEEISPNSPGLSQEGWWISAASLATVSAWNLRDWGGAMQPPPMLVLGDSGIRSLEAWVQEFPSTGGAPQHMVFEENGLLTLRAEAHLIGIPALAYGKAVSWLLNSLDIKHATAHLGNKVRENLNKDNTFVLALSNCVERPIRFGPDATLAATWCVPDGQKACAPALLILNTGGNPRSGHSRLSVKLARSMAEFGFASLRIDVSETGEAYPVLRSQGSNLYCESVQANIQAAIVEMNQSGYPEPIIFGLCSGAYHALQAGLVRPNIGGLVMANVHSFLLETSPRPAQTSQISNATKIIIKPVNWYYRQLYKSEFWKRLFSKKIRVRALSSILFKTLYLHLLGYAQRVLPGQFIIAPRFAEIQRRFYDLSKNNIPVLLIYGEDDPGINELHTVFGAGGKFLKKYQSISLHYLKNVDHTFAAKGAADELIELLKGFLERRKLALNNEN